MNRGPTTHQQFALVFFRALKTVPARNAGFVRRQFLIFDRQRHLTGKALLNSRLFQLRIDGHSLIEHEAVAVVMIAAALFEVFQDATVELKDIIETAFLHKRTGFFAPNAARAEHDDRLIFHLFGQRLDRCRKLTKVIDAEHVSVAERSDFDLVIVSSVQQMNRPAFVEPLFQLLRRQLWRCPLPRINPINAERDNLILNFDEHPSERLTLAETFLNRQITQSRVCTQLGKKLVNGRPTASNEKVDPFLTQQHRAFEIERSRQFTNLFTPLRQSIEFNKLISGDIYDRQFSNTHLSAPLSAT